MSRRFGHQAALMAGLDHSTADAVVMLDSDLQHPPELIPQFAVLMVGGLGSLLGSVLGAVVITATRTEAAPFDSPASIDRIGSETTFVSSRIMRGWPVSQASCPV